jgi:hypothetical protein
MRKVLLLLVSAVFMSITGYGQSPYVLYEDFEFGGVQAAWNPINGATFAVVDNPDTNGNSSAKVGAVTNSVSDFNFMLVNTGSRINLTEYNQMRIKVWSPVAGVQFLFKIEGPGPDVERFVPITAANQWVEYTIDFSNGAGISDLNTFLISFNPFNGPGDGNTYYFDFVAASKPNSRTWETFESGTAALPWAGINGSYNGVVDNPDVSAGNMSTKVASYTNIAPSDFCFALANTGAAFSLAEYNQFKFKAWSPIAPTRVLFKIEGGGQGVEQFIDITVANQWVEYTADLSGGAAFTGLTTFLISFNPFVAGGDNNTYYFDDIVAVRAEKTYENFESPSGITWNAGNGAYNGPVANPDMRSEFSNTSATVGSYTNNPASDFNFVIGDVGALLDLSKNNQFRVSLWSPTASKVLFKLEGNGEAIEATKNIVFAGGWYEYTFDFSSASGLANMNKILIAVTPFETGNSDTWYFDNIYAVQKANCSNPSPDPKIIDDFDCNRNADYRNGFSDLAVVNNPNPTPVNSSPKVGRFTDRPGAFNPLLIEYENVIDLSTNNYVSLKLWAPRPGDILFKLEGGTSPQAEVRIPVTALNTWVEYGADFSAQAGTSHKAIVFFFNAFDDTDQGGVYFVDDIKRTPLPIPPPLEQFENGPFGGANLDWQPFNGDQAIHGTFARIPNPDATGVNTTANVGRYQKGASPFSTLTAFLPSGLDLTTAPQLDLDVWAPAGAANVTMQLVSASQGNKERTVAIPATEEWVKLSFEYSDFADINDYEEIRLLFDNGVASSATYYFDNLAQNVSTVDPCEGTVADLNILDDYECQRNVTYTAGADRLEVVTNPALQVANASLKVGKYTDPANEPWVALVLDPGAPLDLSIYNQLNVQVYAAQTGPMLLKLEGGSSPAREVFVDVNVTNAWTNYVADFSQYAGENHARVAIFFNAGIGQPTEDVWYLDNVKWGRAPYRGCVATYDQPELSPTNWFYFASSQDGSPFQTAANPNPTGINTSATVGVFSEPADGEIFAGMAVNLQAPVALPNNNKTMRLKVLMDQAALVVFKLEGGRDGAPGSGDVPNPATADNNYTTPGQWQELTFDYSALPDNALYDRIALIMNFRDVPVVAKTYYFDDITIGDANCPGANFIFEPVVVEKLSIMPNPANDRLTVQNAEGMEYFVIHNAYGQVVKRVPNNGQYNFNIDLAGLTNGMYVLTGYNAQGQLMANAKFIKQ